MRFIALLCCALVVSSCALPTSALQGRRDQALSAKDAIGTAYREAVAQRLSPAEAARHQVYVRIVSDQFAVAEKALKEGRP